MTTCASRAPGAWNQLVILYASNDASGREGMHHGARWGQVLAHVGTYRSENVADRRSSRTRVAICPSSGLPGQAGELFLRALPSRFVSGKVLPLLPTEVARCSKNQAA